MKHHDTLQHFRLARIVRKFGSFGQKFLIGGGLIFLAVVFAPLPKSLERVGNSYMFIYLLGVLVLICAALPLLTYRKLLSKVYVISCEDCGFSIRLAEWWLCRCSRKNSGQERSFLEGCKECDKTPTALVCPRCEELIYLDKEGDKSNVASLLGKRTWQQIEAARSQQAEAEAEEASRKKPAVQRPVPVRQDPRELLEQKRAMVELAKCDLELLRLKMEQAQYNRPKEEAGSVEASVKNLLERINRVLSVEQSAEIVRQQMTQKFANNPKMVAKIESIIREDLEERA